MDFRSLDVFLSVAETLNFSRSGELLHLSVSAVSRTIQRLEDELGQTLLERDRRRVHLTAAGQEFRAYARRSLTEWELLRRKLGADAGLAGEVSLYCSVTASHRVLAPILASFRQAHPAVEIMLHTGDQADGINRVLASRDDIAVSGRPANLPGRLDFLPLLDSPLRFCMPTAHCALRDQLLDQDTAATEFDWSSVPMIVPERGVTKDLLDEWFRQRGSRPKIYAQVAGHEAIVAMVALGLGVGLAPELVIEAGGMAERVCPVPVPDPLPPLTVGLCSLRQRLASPLVRSLWDVAGHTYRATV